MSATAPDQSAAGFCASLVRASDFERYAATLFVNPEQRRALLALFAFNIEVARVRDQISQPLAGEIRLQWWSDLLDGAAQSGLGDPQPFGRARVAQLFGHGLEIAEMPQFHGSVA